MKQVYLLIFFLLFYPNAHGAENNFELRTLKDYDSIAKVHWSPDGSHLNSINYLKGVTLWDIETGEKISSIPRKKSLSPVLIKAAYNPTDQNTIAWSCSLANIYTRDTRLPDSNLIFKLPVENYAHLETVCTHEVPCKLRNLCWSPDGTKLLTHSTKGVLGIHDIRNGESLYSEDYRATSVTWGPRGILCGTADAKVHILSERLAVIGSFDNNGHNPCVLAWQPNGSTNFAVGNGTEGSFASTVNIFVDDTTRKTLHDPIQMEANAIAWHPQDENILLTGSRSNKDKKPSLVYLWNTSEEKATKRFVGHKNSVTDLAFSPEGRLLASGSKDATVKIWDMALLAAATNSDEEE